VRSSANSERQIKAFGVLKLTLEPSSYRWEFVEAGGATSDSGAAMCH
jgi:acid phosphatase type 7